MFGFGDYVETLVDPRDLKKKAESELQKYVNALLALYDTRCMALFEGMVAGFCVIELLTKDEGNAWLDKVRLAQKT